MKTKIFLTCLLICSIYGSSDFKCPLTTDCFCQIIKQVQGQKEYEISCPRVNSFDTTIPQVSIKIQPEKRVEVQCSFLKKWNASLLPQLHVGVAEIIALNNCRFPRNGFNEVTKRLGITDTKAIVFDAVCCDDENITLSSDHFFGLDDLEYLKINNAHLGFDEDVFESMKNLTVLDLRATNIQLSSHLFNGMEKLERLDLAQNDITDIPDGLFKSMSNLLQLHLWSNKISNVRKETFENLHKLKSLELSSNEIADLPDDAFYELDNLEALNLMSNNFTSLPDNLFRKNAVLEDIKLHRNPQLTVLPNGLFKDLLNLKKVNFMDCSVRNVPEKIFDGSRNLNEIVFRQNLIEELPELLFKDLKYLENLDISFNRLAFLPDKIFWPLKELRILKISHNNLNNLSENLFSSLEDLIELDLSYNRIATIHKFAFQGNNNVKTLLLNNNRLTLKEFDELNFSPFNYLLNLEEIDLSNNHITTFFNDWIENKLMLKSLNLANNEITYVEFSNFDALSRNNLQIDLSYNNITLVDLREAEIISNEKLRDARSNFDPSTTVNLAGNPLICNCFNFDLVRYFEGTIDPSVRTMVNILKDDLYCNSPSSFAATPIGDISSKMLICHMDNFAACPDKCECAYRPWDKALIIECSNQNLTEAPTLKLPSNIKAEEIEVHLEGNLIEQAPREGMGYDNVTRLYLAYNRIADFPWVPDNIKVLELDNNNLTAIGSNILSTLGNSPVFTNLSLHNNPWKCDCNAANFSSFLRTHLVYKQVDANNIRCDGNGRELINLNKKDLCSNKTTLILISSTLITFVLFIIAAVAALYYCYQQEIKVWLFAHNMCLWFVTEEEIDKDKIYDAFISYSHKDEDFVVNKIVPTLEDGPLPYKLCLHYRDWVAGEFISKQITNSVDNSRRTIVVLSKNFLESVWGKMEFRTAHTQAMSEGRARVIVVLHGDLDIEADLDNELKAYLNTNTYVKWGDPWFWEKLRYALPHSQRKLDRRQQRSANIMISINDKLDLVGGPTTPNLGSTPPAVSLDPLLLKSNPLEFKQNVV